MGRADVVRRRAEDGVADVVRRRAEDGGLM